MRSKNKEITDAEAKTKLRRLELDAYASVVHALRAQGSFDHAKRDALKLLCKQLSITEDRHKAEIRRAANDEKLAILADRIFGEDSSAGWSEEGRRAVAAKPRVLPRKTLERILGVSIANLAASAAVGSPPKQAVDGQTKLAPPGSSATTQAPPSTNRLALAAMKLVQTANSVRGDDEASSSSSSSRPSKQPSAPKEPVAMATSTRELRSSAASNVTSTRVRSQAAAVASSSNRRKPGKRIVTSTATGPLAKKFAGTSSSSVATTTTSRTTTTTATTTTNLLSQSRALLASINRTGATTGTTAKTTMTTSSQKTLPPKQMVFPPKTASPSTTTTMTLKPVGVRQSGSAGTMPILMSSGGLQRSIYIVSTSMSQSGTAILVPKATKTTSPAVAFTTSKTSTSTTAAAATRSSAPVTKQTVVSLKTTTEEPTPVRSSLGATDAVVSASSDESLAAQQLISLQSLSKDPSILEASATLLSLQMAPVPPKVTEKAKVEEKREEEKRNEETKEGGGEVGEEEEKKKNEEDAEDSNKASDDDAKEEQSGEKEKETKDDRDEDTETEEEVNVTEVDGGDEKKNASPRAESSPLEPNSASPQTLLPPPSKSPSATALIAPKAIYPETRRSKTPSTPPPPLRIQSKSLTPTSSATFQPLYPAPSPTTKSSSSSTSVEFPQTPPPLLKRTRTSPTSQAQSPPIISPSTAHRSSSGQGFRVRIQGNTVSRALEATASSCPPSLANSRVASPSTAVAAAAARGRSLTPVNELASGKFSAVDSFLESFQLEESSSGAGAPKGNSTRGEGDGGSGGSGGGETDPLSSIIAELADSFPDTDTFLGQNMPASSQLDFDADLLSDVLASFESETGQSSSTIAPSQQQQSATIQPEPLKKRKSPLPPPLSQPQVSATQSHAHQARSGKKGKGSAAAGSYQTRGLSSRRVSVASGDSGQLSDSESGDGLRHSKRKRKLTAIMTDDPYPPPKSETLNVPFWVKTALSLMHRVCRLKGSNRSKGENTAASWFIDPVDVEALPDYLGKVRHPMDFTTIKRKLESGAYRDYTAWNSDMQLVKRNCYAYNPPGHLIRIDCDEVFSFYDPAYAKMAEKWQKTPRDVLNKLTLIQRPIGDVDY